MNINLEPADLILIQAGLSAYRHYAKKQLEHLMDGNQDLNQRFIDAYIEVVKDIDKVQGKLNEHRA